MDKVINGILTDPIQIVALVALVSVFVLIMAWTSLSGIRRRKPRRGETGGD